MRTPEDVGNVLRNEYMPMLTRLRTMPKPVIAAMNGPAVGIGASYALACDIRIATPEAYILEAFVNIGLAPDGGVSWLLPLDVAPFGLATFVAWKWVGQLETAEQERRKLGDYGELEKRIQKEFEKEAGAV